MNNRTLEIEAHRLREAYLESARQFLAPRYQGLSHEQIARILRETMEQLPPMERDAFAALSLQNTYEKVDWGSVLKTVVPIAQMAAPLVGTMIGGPVGGAIGSQVGSMIGNIAGQGAQPTAPPRASQPPPAYNPQPVYSPPRVHTPPAPAKTPAPVSAPSPAPPTPAPEPAIAQLMALISNPQFIQALLGQLLGALGNGSAPVQQSNSVETVPFGALMTTLSELAQQAAEASVRAGGEESERYLMDSAGYYRVDDPSNPEERANVVMALLREDYQIRRTAPEQYAESTSGYDPVTSWLVDAGIVR